MELQFNKSVCSCLHTLLRQVQQQEQTLEVRLPDGMPDVGRVLGAWGQALLRSKEWRKGAMNVTCGVMAWVLYAPEEGGSPQCVEAWIPFQLKWELPETTREGVMRVCCLLQSMDARSISARKLMLRANMEVQGEAMVNGDEEIYAPGELPEDVQLLKKTYPVCLPSEAGEKPFALDEELVLPASCPRPERIVRYHLQPELIDSKVMADKVIFRGMGVLHMLYMAEDGGLYSWDFELPFSQYSELSNEYGQDATASVIPGVTSLELELQEDGKLRFKAGMTGQYVICQHMPITLVEDAYSPRRSVAAKLQTLDLPAVLDSTTHTVHAQQTIPFEGSRVADAAFLPAFPRTVREGDSISSELSGMFQMLYYDQEGQLQSALPQWQGQWELAAGENSQVLVNALPTGKPQAITGGADLQLSADLLLNAQTVAQQGLPMVTALELGELREPDPGRPSVIVRRADGSSLWELAKQSGSTVDAITDANQLSAEPEDGRLLLIPVS